MALRRDTSLMVNNTHNCMCDLLPEVGPSRDETATFSTCDGRSGASLELI